MFWYEIADPAQATPLPRRVQPIRLSKGAEEGGGMRLEVQGTDEEWIILLYLDPRGNVFRSGHSGADKQMLLSLGFELDGDKIAFRGEK